ncbi:MAG: 3,4-dihydroxy-2-butanone-4-phosphate synthase [Halieaceae bacterium]|jgi:3,4-dihydroxy 2-butanone 4-phosphate synthase/GTP cyclohydrolase II|nr:3,4-dihydroxy-2-butanone-4-phosphate synthase [Halieaceae bacterium]
MDEITGMDKPDALLSHIRHARPVLLLLDNSAGDFTGVVVLGAEHCEPEHITFMARKARGLVCLGLNRERAEQLELPLMVEGRDNGAAPFTLSIEASTGIDTGISAADRARTIRVAVAADARPSDLVQPGHIFPIVAADGGVLTQVAAAEAATDLAGLAGLMPAAVFTEVLDSTGDLAQGDALLAFAREHDIPFGRVSDLVTYRLNNQRTVERIREGELDTAYGRMRLTAYRDATSDQIHLALTRGEPQPDTPTLVRVHSTATLRDLIGTTIPGRNSWRFDASLRAIANADCGVLVALGKVETSEELLASIEAVLDPAQPVEPAGATDSYALVGIGAQILRDQGVGRIHLLGAPVKYNALSGFGLEVQEFVPAADPSVHQSKE